MSVVVALTVFGGGAQGRMVSGCSDVRHVVAQSRQVVAYVVRERDADASFVRACVRSSGRRIDPQQGEATFLPPARAVAVDGHLVGLAYQETGDGFMNNSTLIAISDLRHPGRPVKALTAGAGPWRFPWGLDLGLREYVKVASLDIDRHRRVAWIQCQIRGGHKTIDTDIRTDCLRAGSPATVMLLEGPGDIDPSSAAIADPTPLAMGPEIDPRSVRLTSRLVVWTQGGVSRSRRLPPVKR